MSEDQQYLVEEARDSIEAAKILLQNLYPGYAASRSFELRAIPLVRLPHPFSTVTGCSRSSPFSAAGKRKYKGLCKFHLLDGFWRLVNGGCGEERTGEIPCWAGSQEILCSRSRQHDAQAHAQRRVVVNQQNPN